VETEEREKGTGSPEDVPDFYRGAVVKASRFWFFFGVLFSIICRFFVDITTKFKSH
jgi:hypothetical protein